jgi:endonuclease-3
MNGVIEQTMATTINKQRLLSLLCSAGRSKVESEPAERPVLEQFIYGLCRENATAEQAEQAYQRLRERFYDWNEIRVSSVRELEEAFDGMAGAELRAQRLISFLQEVFETTFSFDLEGLEKKGVKVAQKQLSRYQASNDYVTSWVVQRSLAGHAIPLDAPTLRCSRRLGLLDSNAADLETARASLEHLIPKAKGPQWCDSVSQIAAEFCHEDEPMCCSCPMSSECALAQENGVEAASAGRSHRPKPR